MTDSTTDIGTTDPIPTVVIVGRPNVGKSTFFNRLVGEQDAIVEDQPGVTRDRKTRRVSWLGREFFVIDTGGWTPAGSALDEKVSRQVEVAVQTADLVLFMVDAAIGATDEDDAIAQWLRQGSRQVLVVANKADNQQRESELWQFLSFGLGDAHPISALHGRRSGDLLDEVVARLPVVADDESSVAAVSEPTHGPRVAIVGRPNVGKSTLFNRLVGEERSVVHDMPGTTRDSVDTVVQTPNGPVTFVDTAGLRRKARIDESAEYYSLVRALRSIDEADVALLIVDATEGVTSQDQRLAERVGAAGCPIIVVLNKWEMLDTERREQLRSEVGRKLAFLGDSPIVTISALSGKGVHRLEPALFDALEQYHRRVPTRDVNRVIAEAQQRQPAGGGVRVLYGVQGSADPPTFTLFVNRQVPAPYLRYLERSIREAFDFGSVPIKIRVRTKG